MHGLGALRRQYTLNIDGLSEVVGLDTWHHERNPGGCTVEMHGNIRCGGGGREDGMVEGALWHQVRGRGEGDWSAGIPWMAPGRHGSAGACTRKERLLTSTSEGTGYCGPGGKGGRGGGRVRGGAHGGLQVRAG